MPLGARIGPLPIATPWRSHSLRHAFACLRASLARLRYSLELGMVFKRTEVMKVSHEDRFGGNR